ncbi:MAG: hypothetical protein ACE5JQ_09790 [Candidatus Methylomirabilales bacterium]
MKRLLITIALCLAVGLRIGPEAERLEAADVAEVCAEIHDWIVSYVEPFRGHLLRIIVRDPMFSGSSPRVGYWITFPEDWVTKRNDSTPIVRACQDTPGSAYTVEVKSEEGSWVSGAKLLVKKLSADWRKISFTLFADPDDPSSAVAERVIEIPE